MARPYCRHSEILASPFLQPRQAYYSRNQKSTARSTVLFIGRKYYFQPKAWLKIQSVTATEMKNRPRPTGLPQLNHEPHERQFFIWFSYQSCSFWWSWRLLPWCCIVSLLLLDESLSPRRFDDALERRRPTHSSSVAMVSVHVVRRMSSAWLQWDDHIICI
jgi:hypothetical protein